MSYRVVSVTGTAEERRALAAFLAAFVRDGELLAPRPGDDDPAMWERRMGWWWDENAHDRGDSPRGFLLEHEEEGLVGFNGLVPVEYECEGTVIPTLVTTTFFVRDRHRSAVMGLIARQRTLGKTFQIIDGSPSPEMRRLLAKLAYRHAGNRRQYFFPTRRLGGAGARALLGTAGWSFPLPSSAEVAECRLVVDVASWDRFDPPEDGRIHRKIDADSLAWLLKVGSEPRSFFGLLDEEGTPIAYALGVYKERAGLKACLLLDYRDWHPGGAGMAMLLRKILDKPGAAGLDPATGVIVLSRFGGSTCFGVPGRRAESILHFHLPPPWQNHEKASLPVEGDLVLL